ncbi:MAG: hypothetical protein NT027_08000 [Proteobacteria bacterium]|nr:hypothetical protein [Pseudomonadota bacterium]
MKIFCATIALIITTAGCGSSKKSDDPAPAATPTWTSVNTVLVAKCALSGCHSTSLPNVNTLKVNFWESEAKYKEAQASTQSTYTPGAQVTAGKMPKTGSISSDDKSTLVNFK